MSKEFDEWYSAHSMRVKVFCRKEAEEAFEGGRKVERERCTNIANQIKSHVLTSDSYARGKYDAAGEIEREIRKGEGE